MPKNIINTFDSKNPDARTPIPLLTAKSLGIQLENKLLFQELSFNCKPGECWGIIGPNGAGKTTLLHMLAGMIKPTYGEIYLQQKALLTLPLKQRAKLIGLLLQESEFYFPETVWERVLMGRYPHRTHWFCDSKQDHEKTKTALLQMALAPFKNRSVLTLSGGEKRRVLLASLLTQDPSIYLLDEPTNHLDKTHQIHTLTLFKQLAQKQSKLIIAVMHEIALVKKFCDYIILLGTDPPHAWVGTYEALIQAGLLSHGS